MALGSVHIKHHTCLNFAAKNVYTTIFFLFFSRRKPELKTFVSAVIVTIAFLDVLDVTRILPMLSKELYEEKTAIFKHVYCSLGVFHELAIAIFLVSISVAVCVQVIMCVLKKKIRFYFVIIKRERCLCGV